MPSSFTFGHIFHFIRRGCCRSCNLWASKDFHEGINVCHVSRCTTIKLFFRSFWLSFLIQSWTHYWPDHVNPECLHKKTLLPMMVSINLAGVFCFRKISGWCSEKQKPLSVQHRPTPLLRQYEGLHSSERGLPRKLLYLLLFRGLTVAVMG